MDIRLTIRNVERLPDGGPTSYSARDRGFEIGRDGGDWSLPDPDLIISGRHCEIRFEKGGFWLRDLSRNGTFVNGSNQRLDGAYLLSAGDTIRIGRYVIDVSIEQGREAFAGAADPARNGRQPRRLEDPARNAPFFPPDETRAAGHSRASLQLQSGRQLLSGNSAPAADPAGLLRDIAVGAGISPDTFMQRDPKEVAEEIGAVLRIVVDELASMLKARAAAKAMAKSSQQTMISSTGNNPLKFVPGAEEMLEKMFGRRSSGYLDARQSLEEAFRDLKTHEIATYSAMQAALARLLEDISPMTIESRLASSSFTSRKSRAWDAFVAAWEAKEQRHENGMLDAFLDYFSESYSKAAKVK
ncbi:MAG: type VI secretion system-associated FHA domain protein TagH [Mesorhizobium sp.]|nr:type VI secretion system-associated FHA domain protein TagH [Mesorhizobium sp.]